MDVARPAYLHRDCAKRVTITATAPTRAIVAALRDGAQSARNGDTSGLSYADGWAAAATLAELTAFDAIKMPSE